MFWEPLSVRLGNREIANPLSIIQRPERARFKPGLLAVSEPLSRRGRRDVSGTMALKRLVPSPPRSSEISVACRDMMSRHVTTWGGEGTTGGDGVVRLRRS